MNYGFKDLKSVLRTEDGTVQVQLSEKQGAGALKL